uniref:Uncharacterized protein n=1 Tax=Anopheles albimanus TaxID=7167 RepID=A0A182F9D5_ANOAL
PNSIALILNTDLIVADRIAKPHPTAAGCRNQVNIFRSVVQESKW